MFSHFYYRSLTCALLLALPSLTGMAATNLITNGDFSAGNTGFTSGYTFSTFGNGTYTITTDPHIPYPSSISFHDHTTGTGNLLGSDGALTANVILWGTTAPVTVTPNTLYTFTGWQASWGNDGTNHDPDPANLEVRVNGVGIGSSFSPSQDGVWKQFSFNWFSGSNSTAALTIVNLNTAAFGNDPCLDDLSFSVAPEPSSLLLVAAGTVSILGRRRRRNPARVLADQPAFCGHLSATTDCS